MLDAAEAHTSGFGATHEGEKERTACVKTDQKDQEGVDEKEEDEEDEEEDEEREEEEEGQKGEGGEDGGEEEEEHHLVLPLPLLEQSPIEKQPRHPATIALQSPSTPAFTPFTPNG